MMIRGSLDTTTFRIITPDERSGSSKPPGWYFIFVYDGLAQGGAFGPYSTAGKALDAALGSQLPVFPLDKEKPADNFEAFKKKLDRLEATLADVKKWQANG